MKRVNIYYVLQMSWPKCENTIYVKDANTGMVCLDYNNAEVFDSIDLAENAANIAFKQVAKKEDKQFFIQPVMIRETFEIIDPYLKSF